MTLQRRTPYRVELRQPNAEEIMIRDYYSFDPNPSGISPSPDFIGEGASGQVYTDLLTPDSVIRLCCYQTSFLTGTRQESHPHQTSLARVLPAKYIH